MKLKVAEVIVRCLEAEGIEYAFGISGSHYLAFFKALKNSSINYISVKHESSAGFMAAHYAKFAQKPALIMGTAGPGALNLLSGIAELYTSNLPCFILTPIVSSELQGKNVMQEDSGFGNTYAISDIMKCVTKKTITCIHKQNIAAYIRDLFRHCFDRVKGPVHLLVPSDFFEQEIDFCPLSPMQYRNESDGPAEPGKCALISEKLLTAKRPILLVGRRAWYPDIASAIKYLSDTFGIPVALSAGAKGLFDEYSPLFAGILDVYGHRSAEYFIKKSDAVIAIGMDFSELSTIKYDPELFADNLIQLDLDGIDIGRNYRVLLSACGNLGATLEALIREMELRGIQRYFSEDFQIEFTKENQALWMEMDDIKKPLSVPSIYNEISNLVKDNTIILSDIGAAGFSSYRHLRTAKSCYSTLVGNYTMGHGIAGAIGAKLACPQKKIISISGDGAFLMNGMEIATARQYSLPIIWVLFVDNCYGMIEWSQKILYNNLGFCTDLYVPDLHKMAEAFSIDYYKVEDAESLRANFWSALKKYDEEKKSCLIELKFDSEITLPVKPRIVKFIKDMGNSEESSKSPFLMKAFKRMLREKV
jgi:acetolactate synthase-1/2/3 large subunit